MDLPKISIADKLGLSERQREIGRLILDVGFLVLMISIFLFARNVMHHRYQICSNPSKYCPYEYTIIDKKADIDWGLMPILFETPPNRTLVEENLYRCMASYDRGCLKDGPAFMKWVKRNPVDELPVESNSSCGATESPVLP